MTRDKQLAAGALALVLFGGLAVKQFRDDAKLGSKAAQDSALPKFEATEGADKLTVTNGDKSVFVLEKKGDTWMVSKPLSAKGNQANIKQALDNLKEIKIREQVSSNPDAELLKSYELDASKGVHVVVEQAGKVLVDATFGKSGGRGQLLSVGGKPGIFAATGYSNFLFARDAKGWRDSEIVKFEEFKATGLHYELGDTKLDFTLAGTTWSGTANGKALERFDKPSRLTIDLKDASPIKVAVGGETPTKGRWVKREGAAVATALPSYAIDWVAPEVSKFQKAAPEEAKPKTKH